MYVTAVLFLSHSFTAYSSFNLSSNVDKLNQRCEGEVKKPCNPLAKFSLANGAVVSKILSYLAVSALYLIVEKSPLFGLTYSPQSCQRFSHGVR